MSLAQTKSNTASENSGANSVSVMTAPAQYRQKNLVKLFWSVENDLPYSACHSSI
jgi:hypothetical protein